MDSLRREMMSARKRRDQVTVVACRSALAAVANAEAVPSEESAGAVEQAKVGAGAADAPRRELSEAEVRAIIAAHLAELDTSVAEYQQVGQPAAAEEVAAQAAALRQALPSSALPS